MSNIQFFLCLRDNIGLFQCLPTQNWLKIATNDISTSYHTTYKSSQTSILPLFADLSEFASAYASVQVNLCQKLLLLHQLTHNMTTELRVQYM